MTIKDTSFHPGTQNPFGHSQFISALEGVAVSKPASESLSHGCDEVKVLELWVTYIMIVRFSCILSSIIDLGLSSSARLNLYASELAYSFH
jgi:hypothetical protein